MESIHNIINIAYRFPQILTGMFICKAHFLAHYKYHLLSTWHDTNKRSNIDKLLYADTFNYWLRFEYLNEPDPDKREMLKSMAMGGISGRNWARCYDEVPLDFNAKVGHMTLREASPLYDEIETICQNTKTKLVIIQIGSSSGREIAYFATKFPMFEHIGTDIYQEVVDYSINSHNLPNLTFLLSPAKNISQILFHYRNSDVIVYSSGSLQYVQPEHLRDFFSGIASHLNVKLIISEPANEFQESPDRLKGSVWRGNFSYTHNYKYYAEEADIRTLQCAIIRPYFPYEDFPMHKNTVHYYYYGETQQ
jgi:hypothetical protein